MLAQTPFYFSSIRNVTAAFGTLFNNVVIQRLKADGSIDSKIKVPLAYASADKTITMLRQQDAQRRENQMDIKISLPRMSFEMTGIGYDANRKTQTMTQNVFIPPQPTYFDAGTNVSLPNSINIPNHGLTTGRSVTYSRGSGTAIGGLTNNQTCYIIKRDNNTISLASSQNQAYAGTAINFTSTGSGTHNLKAGYATQYNPIPYNINFSLYAYVKYIDDGLQIVEQILPYFTPFYAVTINDLPTFGVKRDVTFTLNSVSSETAYEGPVEEDRVIQWTMEFTANAWIYPPIADSKIIKKTYTNFFDLDNEQLLATIQVEVDPLTADRDDQYTIKTTITEP